MLLPPHSHPQLPALRVAGSDHQRGPHYALRVSRAVHTPGNLGDVRQLSIRLHSPQRSAASGCPLAAEHDTAECARSQDAGTRDLSPL